MTALINAEQQLLQNTSRKLLLQCSEKFRKFDRKTPLLESVCNKVAGLKLQAFMPVALLRRDSNTGAIL